MGIITMKMNFKSLVAGMLIATSGSLLASSTTLPFTFQSGEKAKAAEVNANFSALAGAVNNLDTRTATLESNTPAAPIGIDLPQVNAAVGSTVVILGATFVIKEDTFNDPFNNATYKIKYASNTHAMGWGISSNAEIRYPDQPTITLNELTDDFEAPPFRVNNGVNGFNAFLTETIYMEKGLTYGTSQSINLYIYLTEKLVISLGADDYGTTATSADIELKRKDLRSLLSYVVVTKL